MAKMINGRQISGVGIAPATGEDGVTRGYVVTVRVDIMRPDASKRRRSEMYNLQEVIQGSEELTEYFNFATRDTMIEFAALEAAEKLAEKIGCELLTRERERLGELREVAAARKAARAEKAAEKPGSAAEMADAAGNGKPAAKKVMKLPKGGALARLEAIADALIAAANDPKAGIDARLYRAAAEALGNAATAEMETRNREAAAEIAARKKAKAA